MYHLKLLLNAKTYIIFVIKRHVSSVIVLLNDIYRLCVLLKTPCIVYVIKRHKIKRHEN
ncbi:hypothetical protein HanLR1_Chr09g0298271 [Helianthus annuus]|nr:hypothetical protein HanHA89_Chr09g0318071 [Helianthus annuus]KAJ0705694.1 hypothetical protein HanLR1_Chr09g0298271 [Helianthus annuus]